MNPNWWRIGRVKPFKHSRKGKIGIGGPQRWQRDVRISRSKNDCRGFGRRQLSQIFLIRNKGHLVRLRVLDTIHSGNLDISVSSQLTSES
jgi:hypothetical protein